VKVVYVLPGCGVAGGVAVACQHANRLHARGHDVTLVSESSERVISWFPNQRVPVVGIDAVPADPDVLVATGWSTSFRVAILRARHKFYFVQSNETRFHPRNSAWEHMTRLSYTLNFNYLTEARWIRSWLAEQFGQQAELVPNGLDDAIFYPAEPLEPKGERPRILLEGAIDLPYKGMAEAFRAVAREDVEVWCVSSLGKPRSGWRCDRFFGQVPMDDMRRIYSSCDILLKLSRVEGFFGPPIEMMACGGAVVVGRVTGYDEYIEDGVNALVVDPSDTDQATAAVRQLIQDPDLRARLIEAGTATARRWRWEPSIDILEQFFLDVVEGRRGIAAGQRTGELDRSVAFFYGLLRGDDTFVAPRRSEESAVSGLDAEDAAAMRAAGLISAGAIARMQTDPTEKLLARLRHQAWFRGLAKLTYGMYRRVKQLKSQLAARRRGR
jgi:glycosyltransferase involved in cell wall biosynthesis